MGGHQTRAGVLAWNSTILSSGSRDKNILQHDIHVPTDYISKFAGHRSEVCGLKWSHDNRELASGGKDNQLLDFQDQGGPGHGTLQFFCVDTFDTDALLCYISAGIYENACRLKGGAASALPLVHLFVNSILLLLLLFEARCYPHSQGALLSRMSDGVSSVVVLKATDVMTDVYDIDHKLSG